jgi:predicted outer membrane protein
MFRNNRRKSPMNLTLASLRSPRALALSFAIFTVGSGPVSAQSIMSPTQVMPDDRTFITSMLQESRDQLALARLATQRASSAVASTAAAETTDEWSSLRSRLMSIAYAQGAPVRGTFDPAGQTMLQRLGRTPGRRFDVAYLRDAQLGNQAALAQLNHEEGTTDPKVVRFLAYALPIVSRDEQMTADDLIGNSARG